MPTLESVLNYMQLTYSRITHLTDVIQSVHVAVTSCVFSSPLVQSCKGVQLCSIQSVWCGYAAWKDFSSWLMRGTKWRENRSMSSTGSRNPSSSIGIEHVIQVRCAWRENLPPQNCSILLIVDTASSDKAACGGGAACNPTHFPCPDSGGQAIMCPLPPKSAPGLFLHNYRSMQQGTQEFLKIHQCPRELRYASVPNFILLLMCQRLLGPGTLYWRQCRSSVLHPTGRLGTGCETAESDNQNHW